MKKTDGLILGILVVFDILFYQQVPGINVSIFGVVLVLFSIVKKPKLIYNKAWIVVAFVSLLAAALVGTYGDVLSLFACIISFSLLASHLAEKRSSIGVALSGMAFTYVRSPFIFFKIIRVQLIRWQHEKKNQGFLKAGVIAVTFVVVLIFFFIYRSSSLLFYNLTQKINLDFISFFFICFTINGLLMIIAFKHYAPIRLLEAILDKPGKRIAYQQPQTEDEKEWNLMEQFTGIVLLTSLNALLIVVNILDVSYLVNRQLPQGVTYADFIHQGVGMLIVSIILAISIILYFFRNALNFSNHRWLKVMAYGWVTQNLFMVVSNVSRNFMYIEAYGLTEKRIGVYFYLLLAAIGLVTTLIKIFRKQSNAYLVRSTSMVFFAVLLAACMVNWDNVITRHDLLRSDANTNISYLNDLSYTNIPQMLNYMEVNKQNKDNAAWTEAMENLDRRILCFIHECQEFQGWQSVNIMRDKTYGEIINRKIERIFLQNADDQQLKALRFLPDVKELVARNSYFSYSNEWAGLRNLKRLTLDSCKVTDLKFTYYLKQLEYLDVSGNNIVSLEPLYVLKNLKELHLSSIDSHDLELFHFAMPHTKVVYKHLRNSYY